jgi:hypothetical protein
LQSTLGANTDQRGLFGQIELDGGFVALSGH